MANKNFIADKTTLDQVKTLATTINNEIGGMSSGMAKEATLTDISGTLNTVKTNVDAIKSASGVDLSGLENSIAEVKTDVTSVSQGVSDIKTAFDDLDGRLDGLHDETSSDLNVIKERLSSVGQVAAGAKSNTENLDSTLTTINTNVNSTMSYAYQTYQHTANIDSIKTSVDAIKNSMVDSKFWLYPDSSFNGQAAYVTNICNDYSAYSPYEYIGKGLAYIDKDADDTCSYILVSVDDGQPVPVNKLFKGEWPGNQMINPIRFSKNIKIYCDHSGMSVSATIFTLPAGL